MMAGLPKLTARSFMRTARKIYSSVGEKRCEVAFFTGCVMDNIYPEVHRATIRVLRWNGFEVHVPVDQGCCGALHHHNGSRDKLAKLSGINIRAFQQFDTIILNSAGCGAELKEYPQQQFAVKVKDISEFPTNVGVVSPKKEWQLENQVIWDAPCHLIHGQTIIDEPTALLRQFGFRNFQYMQSKICCGAAGSYAITQRDSSEAILKLKMEDLGRMKPNLIITANPGCHIQLNKGVERFLPAAGVKHICEVLDECYQRDPGYRETFNL